MQLSYRQPTQGTTLRRGRVGLPQDGFRAPFSLVPFSLRVNRKFRQHPLPKFRFWSPWPNDKARFSG